MNRFGEQALTISGPQGPLIGVFCPSPIPTGPVALIVAAQPQTRSGAHRMFRQLARRLADRGVCSLRLDCAGWGDSPGTRGTFEESVPDLLAALEHLAREHPGRSLAIVGLCDGASAAILAGGSRSAGKESARIAAIGLINPCLRSGRIQAPAMVRSDHPRRLLSPAFWWRLLRGKTSWRDPVGASSRYRSAAIGAADEVPEDAAEDRLPEALLGALARFDQRVLTVLSGEDPTSAETEALIRTDPGWHTHLERNGEILRIPGADESFSGPEHWEQACDWLSARLAIL